MRREFKDTTEPAEHTNPPASAGRWLSRLAGLACVVLLGCASPGRPIIESPLSVEEQQQELLKIVPRGTPRAEVNRRLREAGIDYSPGHNGSIYYCALWNREDAGERWHINVALLFDEQGRLYQTRPADSPSGAMVPPAQEMEPVTQAQGSRESLPQIPGTPGQGAWRKSGTGNSSWTGQQSATSEESERRPFHPQK